MRSIFSLNEERELSATKFIARRILKTKSIIPMTEIVAIDRNLFLNRLDRPNLKARLSNVF